MLISTFELAPNVGYVNVLVVFLKVNVSSSSIYEKQLLTTASGTRGLFYDKDENTLYWRNNNDLAYGKINNTTPATLMDVKSFSSSIVYGFSIDTQHQKIYWTGHYELFVGDLNITAQSINNQHSLHTISSISSNMLVGVTVDTHTIAKYIFAMRIIYLLQTLIERFHHWASLILPPFFLLIQTIE